MPETEPSLRPFQPGEFIENPDGTRSTERTITFQLPDGRWMNAPSLWMTATGPIDLSKREDLIREIALRFEISSGKSFPRFISALEAIGNATNRSAAGGAFSGEITE